MVGIVLIFILSIVAWAKGDNSMKGFVIGGVIFIVYIYLEVVVDRRVAAKIIKPSNVILV